jgi:broad specificity phosphatase PhoE
MVDWAGMKLILVRHGETEENKKGILQGHMHGTLSKEGIDQAKRLAKRLSKEKIDAIYSSDLKRAADTAKEIVKYHPEIPLSFTEELREINLGSNTGKKKAEIDPKHWPSDSETPEQIQERARKLIDRIYKKHPKDTVLFVSHNGFKKNIIRYITNKSLDETQSMPGFGNTSVSIFEIKENNNHKILLLNCTKHLDD